MTALSITLPNSMVEKSTQIANELGISRTAFIKLAIGHELKRLSVEKQQKAMSKALTQMQHDAAYLKESQKIDTGFADEIVDDGNEWWIK